MRAEALSVVNVVNMRCNRVGQFGAIVFMIVALLWTACLVAAPYAITHTGSSSFRLSLMGRVAVGTYVAASLICHQRRERSFRLWGAQMPVCARCFGLYASVPIGGAMALMLPVWLSLSDRRSGSTPTRFWRRLLLAGLIPTVAVACAEWIGLYRASLLLRATGAVPLGVAVGLVVGAAIQGELR